MIGSLDNPPIVIRSSRRKTLLALMGCLAFIGAGLWTVQNASAKDPFSGWVAIIIFGLLAIGAFWRLVSPATLTVSEDGLSYTGLTQKTVVPWRDVKGFKYEGWVWGVVGTRMGLKPPAVTMDFVAFSSSRRLPVGWETDAEPLCELLNRALARWGTTGK